MILSLFLMCRGVTYIGLVYTVSTSGQAEEKKVEKTSHTTDPAPPLYVEDPYPVRDESGFS